MAMVMTEPVPVRPEAAQVRAAVSAALSGDLAGYLGGQRWFGDKDRVVSATTCLDVALAPRPAGGWFVLAPIQAAFAAGPDSRYLTLLQAVPRSGLAPERTSLGMINDEWSLTDVGPEDGFADWWLGQFDRRATLFGENGEYVWEPLPGFAEARPGAGSGVLISAVGQSNTTVRYGTALFGKIFRRLRPGINPDEEISRFLATRTAFHHLPIPYGSVRLGLEGETYPIGVLFSFVPSVAEGWGWTQEWLGQSPLPSYAAPARLLGQRTGELHLALASDMAAPAFAPEPVTAEDIAGWSAAMSVGVDQVLATLADQLNQVPAATRPFVERLLATGDGLRERVTGNERLAGTVKTRVHGDYHLGQVLRTPDDDWVLLDFEGEPARTIAERRAKTAPMKDVADMLRSFGYARGMAGRDPAADQGALDAWLAETRAGFLDGYRETVRGGAVALVPADDGDFATALAAWELAKALYEIRYELGNRPDWLDVPIRTLVTG